MLLPGFRQFNFCRVIERCTALAEVECAVFLATKLDTRPVLVEEIPGAVVFLADVAQGLCPLDCDGCPPGPG